MIPIMWHLGKDKTVETIKTNQWLPGAGVPGERESLNQWSTGILFFLVGLSTIHYDTAMADARH